jgi:hypothetical protein
MGCTPPALRGDRRRQAPVCTAAFDVGPVPGGPQALTAVARNRVHAGLAAETKLTMPDTGISPSECRKGVPMPQ